MRSSRRQAAILATAAALVLSAPWQAQAQTFSPPNALDDTIVVPTSNQNQSQDGSGGYTCAELNLYNVSVYGLDGVFCVVDAACYGNMDNYNGTACPTVGAVDLSGNTTLVSGSCCAPFPNGTLGCMLVHDDKQPQPQPRCLQLSSDGEKDNDTIHIPPEMLDWSASSDSDFQSADSSHSGPTSTNPTIVVVSSASSSSGVEDSGQVEYPVFRRGSESVSFTSDYGSAAAGELTSSSTSTSSASSSDGGSGATETPSASTATPTSTSGQSYASASTSGSLTDAGTGSTHSSASSTATSSHDYSTGSSSAASADVETPSSATSSSPDAGSSGSSASASASTPSSAASSTTSSKSATTTTPAPTGTAYLPTIPATIESSSSSISSNNTTASSSSSSQNDTWSTSTSSKSSNVANMPVFVIVGLSACAAVVFGAFLLRRKVKPPSQSEATVMIHSGSPEHESTGVSSMYMQALSSPRLVRASV